MNSRNVSRSARIYLIAVTVLMYLPILFVIIYSVNESKISSVWDGFSLKWYAQLFRDRAIGEAIVNSLILELRMRFFEREDYHGKTAEAHRRIYEAVKARDEELAVYEMGRHLKLIENYDDQEASGGKEA